MDQVPENLKYPIGQFKWPKEVSSEEIHHAIRVIAALPAKMKAAVDKLQERQLDTPYRQDGWTVRQVVHHVADSHMNAYIRFKLALTEDTPTIKPYDQARWAMLLDSRMLHPDVSLSLISLIHIRWVHIMENMSDDDWNRSFHHPGDDRTIVLRNAVLLYAWHGQHHLGHITSLSERMGW